MGGPCFADKIGWRAIALRQPRERYTM